jgi:hypothetical protein
MGWWHQSREGVSFVEAGPTQLLWGDGVADTMADACEAILKEFQESANRRPTNGEIRAGLEFHLLSKPDDEEYARDV